MTKDHANGLEFTYNSLNLLHQVKENGMVKATYTYLADGTKLAARTEAGTDGLDYLGRWMTMDPKAEKYHSMTPYGYCGNNPISNIDWFGMDYWSTNDPGQIAAFFDALKGGYIGYHDFSVWNHMTDNEFASRLSYNDKNNTYYWSEGR